MCLLSHGSRCMLKVQRPVQRVSQRDGCPRHSHHKSACFHFSGALFQSVSGGTSFPGLCRGLHQEALPLLRPRHLQSVERPPAQRSVGLRPFFGGAAEAQAKLKTSKSLIFSRWNLGVGFSEMCWALAMFGVVHYMSGCCAQAMKLSCERKGNVRLTKSQEAAA